MFNSKGNGSYNGNRGNSFNQKVEFDFEKKGYLKDGIIREELITEEAEKIAREFNINRLSTSQLRAFFNEVKAIKNRVKEDGSNYNAVFPLILMLKSKAEYKGSSKGNSKIPAVFKDFLIANIDRLSKDKKEGNGKGAFDAFVMFFEAVVGYFYGVNGGR
ncbi:MAG: type III-A CRISPR-associated protein Csm2 [Cetobacterium sp.]